MVVQARLVDSAALSGVSLIRTPLLFGHPSTIQMRKARICSVYLRRIASLAQFV